MHLTILISGVPNTGYENDAAELLGYLQRQDIPSFLTMEQTARGVEGLRQNIMPGVMESERNLWLAICESLEAKELLVIPLSPRVPLDEYPGLVRAISNTDGGKWSMADGWRNLSLFKQNPGRFHDSLDFEILAANYTVDQLFSGLPVVTHDIRRNEWRAQVLQNASGEVAQLRGDSLSAMAESDDLEERQTKLQEFDDQVVQNLEAIVRAIDDYPISPHVQSFLDQFDRLLDPQSRRFLISADKVRQAVEQTKPEYFDYALPGSGLWKSVERELNMSVIWKLRFHKRIGTSSDAWAAASTVNSRDPIGYDVNKKYPISLNTRDSQDKERFQGIELGSIKLILAYWNSAPDDDFVRQVMSSFDRNERRIIRDLPSVLEEVRILRNRYAHVEEMSEDRFRTLHALVLGCPGDNPAETTFGRIMLLKKKVIQNINPGK